MRAVIARVSRASVRVDGKVVSSINAPDTGGLLVLLGVCREDDAASAEKMARKIAELRLLDGELSAQSAHAPVLVVSQFTLYGRTAKGRRPSWSDAAPAKVAEPLVCEVVNNLREKGVVVDTGVFGAHMEVESVNDGPFTVIVEC